MKRSKHSLSHYKLQTLDMGELVPIGLYEVLPGDTIQHQTSLLCRLSPMLAPVMHPVVARIHHWFVPTRLIWDDFEKFITGGPDGLDASVPPWRTLSAGGPSVGTLADYLGVPTANANTTTMSFLPFRAYSLIWNEWYRDQDLQTELVISKASGNDTTTNGTLQNVAWEKDYFTTSRPWPQKGPAITLPLGVSAPVKSTGVQAQGRGAGAAMGALITTGSPNPNIQVTSGSAGAFDWGPSGQATTGLYTDLTGATAASINDIREAFALQSYAENRARFGSRYVEYLRYLGVRSSDARLQRPEYLGGGKQVIQMSEVLQTAPTTSGTPNVGVGQLLGHGIGAMRSARFRRFFEEHGFVISLLSVKPKTMYVQGLRRLWSRNTKEAFFQKELQFIGQQEVLAKEIYPSATPDAIWGYQDRYDEYRRIESGIAGEFRTTTLDFWHMARIFASAPTLNAAFVSANPTKRIFAVQTNDCLWTMANHSIQARRLVARTGTPAKVV